MMVTDAKYTLPNISLSAVHRVESQGGAAAQRFLNECSVQYITSKMFENCLKQEMCSTYLWFYLFNV